MDSVIKRSDPTEDYELLQKVGGGTFGEVYKSRNIRTGELAAVKVVKLEAGDNFAVIQQEIIVLKDCVHPNIISYYGSYLRRDRLWIVMEYCSGGSLQDIYQLTGPLMELQIAFVCRETLKGLSYLHRRGKIHRDVKGANILLTHSGDVKLADFGVAAQITATLGKRKSFIGTPYWMAPEVASVERRGGYGSECDVWAVGITAIELAELQPPLFDLHPMQVLYLMTKSSYKAPRLKDKQKWSANFQDFVKSCLTKNPKKRPSPEKLLTSHPFVIGALSSRLTRDLLDRVNNPGSSRLEPPPQAIVGNQLGDSLSNMNLELNEAYKWESTASTPSDTEHESSPRPFRELNRCYYEERTLPAKEHPPLPDVVSGDSLLDDRNGVIHDDDSGTLTNNYRKVSAQDFAVRKFRIEDALRIRTDFRIKADRSASLDYPNSIRAKDRNGVKIRNQVFDPMSERSAVSCYGLPPIPQVSMGAGFFNIFHNCQYRVNHTAYWMHPLSGRPFLFVAADEGIYSLDLNELQDENMTLIHERRCSWLYIVGNVLMAVQGKTPYLYRHDLMQLIQQQPLTKTLTKTMTRIPEKFKPKVLLATIRIPETKDCLLCSVDRNPFNDNLFMCCAVPNAVLLFQWYEPKSMFVMMKKVDVDRFPQLPQRPFHLIFRSTSDFPQVCIGLYKNEDRDDKLDFHTVSFDDVGKLEDFLVRSNNMCDSDTLKPFSSRVVSWDRKTKLDVVAMKQLDRDSMMLAFDNKIILTSLEGHFKETKFQQTSFTFNFPIDFAIPLPDSSSVIVFHRHGIQGRSFFNGSTTQDLYDPSKIYQFIGSESLVVLKSRTVNLVKHSASSASILETPVEPHQSDDDTKSSAAVLENSSSGHESTMNKTGFG